MGGGWPGLGHRERVRRARLRADEAEAQPRAMALAQAGGWGVAVGKVFPRARRGGGQLGLRWMGWEGSLCSGLVTLEHLTPPPRAPTQDGHPGVGVGMGPGSRGWGAAAMHLPGCAPLRRGKMKVQTVVPLWAGKHQGGGAAPGCKALAEETREGLLASPDPTPVPERSRARGSPALPLGPTAGGGCSHLSSSEGSTAMRVGDWRWPGCGREWKGPAATSHSSWTKGGGRWESGT